MKSLRVVLALTLFCVWTSAVRAETRYSPIPYLASKLEHGNSTKTYGTAWLYEITDDSLYFLIDWKNLSTLTDFGKFTLSGGALGAKSVSATFVGVAYGYGIAVFSLPRDKVNETVITRGMLAINAGYKSVSTKETVRVGLYGYSVFPTSVDDLSTPFVEKVKLMERVRVDGPDFGNHHGLSDPTRLAHVPCPQAPFASHCYSVPLVNLMTAGAGLALARGSTDYLGVSLGGIALEPSSADTTPFLPIETALHAAHLIRTQAVDRVVLGDASGTFEWKGHDKVEVMSGPLKGTKVTAPVDSEPNLAELEYLKELPKPYRNLDNSWAGFGFYLLVEDGMNKPDKWDAPYHFFVDFVGLRNAIPKIQSLARHRSGIKIKDRVYHRLDGKSVDSVSEFCARYLSRPSDELETTTDAFALPNKLSLSEDRMGTRTFADVRRMVSRDAIAKGELENDTRFHADKVKTLVEAYTKERDDTHPLRLIDVLFAHASQKQFAIVGAAILTRARGKLRIATADTLFGKNAIEMNDELKADGPNRLRYAGPMQIETGSRFWVKPEVKFSADAWGVLTVDKLPGKQGYQVTVLITYQTPKKALREAHMLMPDALSVDSITFRAE